MEESREERVEAIQPGFEQPDLESLRASYKGPSRWRLQLVRLSQSLKNLTIPWTALLALAIVVVVAVTYLTMT